MTSYTFTTLPDDPFATPGTTVASGINDAGQIIGSYKNSSGTHSFIYTGGSYTTLDDPLGTNGTNADGINDIGKIVGSYVDISGTTHGFLYSGGGNYQTADEFGDKATIFTGISQAGVIVGYDIDSSGKEHGLAVALGEITLDDPLGVMGTAALGVNDATQIVGSYKDSTGKENGFIYTGGTYTTLDDPLGTKGTVASGINDSGQIVGYYIDSSGTEHGFVDVGGIYTTVDNALGTNTVVTGINNAGQITGYYTDSSGANHSFLATPQPPTTYSFATLSVPMSASTQALGINDLGQISGNYTDSSGNNHNFLYSGGTYATLNEPSSQVIVWGIDDAGAIVGSYVKVTDTGNLNTIISIYGGGTYTTLTAPVGTATGINDAGQIVGYNSLSGVSFLYSSGTYTTLNDPLSVSFGGPIAGPGTAAFGINHAGQIVGAYVDSTGKENGFIYNSGTYTTLDDPLGTQGTVASGINDAGQIVGDYTDKSGTHGFIYSGGTYTTLDDPLGTMGTELTGINNAGQIVGSYQDSSGTSHAFLADPQSLTTPTPAATVQQEIAGLYVGLYGVAATQAGIQFWINTLSAFDPSITTANATTTAISAADEVFLGQQFVQTQSTYFNSLYGSDSDMQFVTQLYQNLTNSAGSMGGVSYWVGLLTAAEAANGNNVLAARAGVAGQFIHDLMSDNLTVGATALGLTAVQYQALVTGQQAMLDKVEIAQYWATETAAPGGSILNYTTESGPAFAAAQHVLLGITSDPSTVTVTITGINNAVAQQNLSLV